MSANWALCPTIFMEFSNMGKPAKSEHNNGRKWALNIFDFNEAK